MKQENPPETTNELSDRDKELILFGVGLGRTYWDRYYGSDFEVAQMGIKEYWR